MMRILQGGGLGLIEGVWAEPVAGGDRLILWVPLGRDGRDLLWERVASVVGDEVAQQGGVRSIPATSYRARQPVLGAIGRLYGVLTRRSADRGWAPPGGGPAERTGGRRADLVLAWTEEVEGAESRVRARWPAFEGIRQVGASMFVIAGVVASTEPEDGGTELPSSASLDQAEALLEAARKAGSRAGEASALTDLGVMRIKLGRPAEAVESLEAALAISREADDPARLADVAAYLGTALMASGQVARGLEMLEDAAKRDASLGDRFAEKLILERLGRGYAAVGDLARALACFGRGIELSRAVGDRRHEAILLWQSAIRLAELGRRDEAIAAARLSIDGLVASGDPKAAWYAEHLSRYREGRSSADLEGVVDASAAPTASGPGPLKMALSAGKAMATFLGSALEKVAPEVRRERLAICAGCEHHTGLRCRLCGCFTAAKTWLPHEACPIGRWTERVRRGG